MGKDKSKNPIVKNEVVETTVTPNYDVAVVLNGNYEIRRYSLSEHGENFSELAKDFASKNQYTVKLEEAKVGIKCPSCGHVFKI